MKEILCCGACSISKVRLGWPCAAVRPCSAKEGVQLRLERHGRLNGIIWCTIVDAADAGSTGTN